MNRRPHPLRGRRRRPASPLILSAFVETHMKTCNGVERTPKFWFCLLGALLCIASVEMALQDAARLSAAGWR